MINGLAWIYGINKSEGAKQFIDSIVKVGTVSAAAKLAISGLKAIPGINLGASVLNAIIAGSIVAAIGQGCIYAFEQVYTGKKTVADIDWVEKFMESKISSQMPGIVKDIADKINNNTDSKIIAKEISETFINAVNESERA